MYSELNAENQVDLFRMRRPCWTSSDRSIVGLLQTDATLAYADLGERVGLLVPRPSTTA